MEQITVLESLEGKFGKQIKDKSGYLSFGKFYRGEMEFPVGTVLSVDLYVSPKGNRYINSANTVEVGQAAVQVSAKRGRPAKANTPVSSVKTETNQGVNWDEIGRGKTASLFVEAILSNPNLSQSLDQLDLDAIEETVWKLVDVVFRTRKEK